MNEPTQEPPSPATPPGTAQANNAQADKKPFPKALIVVLILVLGCVPAMAILGIMAAIAIPAFTSYVKKSKVAEARSNIGQLQVTVQYECETNGSLPFAAGPIPVAPATEAQRGDFGADPVFHSLGFAPSEVYYSYSIVPTGPEQVSLIAEGDLDGDGQRSRFESICTLHDCSCSAVYIENELE